MSFLPRLTYSEVKELYRHFEFIEAHNLSPDPRSLVRQEIREMVYKRKIDEYERVLFALERKLSEADETDDIVGWSFELHAIAEAARRVLNGKSAWDENE